MARADLAERPQQPIFRGRCVAKPPSALLCFIGTSPNGIPFLAQSGSWAKTPLELRDVQQRSALLVSSFLFLDFVSRGTSPLTYRDRGRMGGMAMAMAIGWPPPGGLGLAPVSIGY